MAANRDWKTDFNHADPAYASSMWDVMSELRRECPVAHGQAFGGFKVLSTYQDVRRAYLKPKEFLSGQGATIPQLKSPFPAIPVETDGAEHRAFKALVMRWLNAKAVEALTPKLRALVDEQIDSFAARGRCDFVAEFSYPLPAAVISMIMGLPRTEWQIVKDLFGDILEGVQSGDPEVQARGWSGLIAYLAQQIEDRRANPRNDMLTELAQATIMGRPLTYEETVGIAYTLVTAGQDTTSNTIGMMARHLVENPELKARLIEDPSRIPDAIEEMLRWFGPVQTTSRVVAEDIEVSGCPVHKGERVALLIGSANRDESIFANADAYDMDRENKQRHLGFGFGEHVCAGQQLARVEMRIVFERLLARLPDFELDGEPRVSFPAGIVYGLSSLPLRFTPEQRKAVHRAASEPAVMGPYSVRTLIAGSDCDDAMSVIEYVAGEGSGAEAPHGQGREDVAIVVLEGAATFVVEGTTHVVTAGQSLFIPRGMKFQRISIEVAPVRYTMTFTPGGFDRFFPDASDMIARRLAEGTTMAEMGPYIRALQESYGMVLE